MKHLLCSRPHLCQSTIKSSDGGAVMLMLLSMALDNLDLEDSALCFSTKLAVRKRIQIISSKNRTTRNLSCIDL